MIRVIALGAGVQSSAMYLLSCAGELPRADLAIFADTQQEPPWVYEQVEYLTKTGSIPIRIATAGDLGDSQTGNFASVPFWVQHPDGSRGMGRRQCTREYKIDVLRREYRKLLGLEKGQRAPLGQLEEWVGISLDEAHRAKPSRYRWITSRWPLLFDVPKRRGDCESWLRRNGHPIPAKSACVFCPFRRPTEWARWRVDHPELFAKAVEWDERIRSSGRGMVGKQYILDSLEPLADLPEKPAEGQDLFGNECSGHCGV